MIPRFSAIIIALCFSSTLSVQAQQSTEPPPPSSAPSVQGPQVPSSNKPKPTEDQSATTGEVPVLNPAKAPQDQKPGGDHADTGNGVGADKSEHETYERVIANFTIALAFATFGLMIVTGGLWWETRKLAVQAKEASRDTKEAIRVSARSADAADRAASSAAESLATERAWITFNGIDITRSRNGFIGDTPYERALGLRAIWINSGRTPAIKARYHSQIITTLANEAMPLVALPEEFGDAALAVTGPSQPGGSGPLGISEVDLARIEKGEIKAYLYARVEYETIFSQDRKHSEVFSQIVFAGRARDENGEVWPGVALQLLGAQNTVA